MLLVLYHVAKPLFGDDKIFQAFTFQFPAQAGNIYGQCVVINEAVTFPESCHERISGNCIAGVLEKNLQNAEFIFGKRDIVAVLGQGTAGRIEDSTFVFQYISGSPEGIGAAENGLYFGSQDIHVKWFCNKIIGAAAHCHDHIHVIGSGGNKDDRYLRDSADFLTPVKTIVKWQLQIQQDELRIETGKFLYNIGKILCAGDIISPGTEILFQKVCDDLIVFDDKNTVHGCSFLCRFYVAVHSVHSNLVKIIPNHLR